MGLTSSELRPHMQHNPGGRGGTQVVSAMDYLVLGLLGGRRRKGYWVSKILLVYPAAALHDLVADLWV